MDDVEVISPEDNLLARIGEGFSVFQAMLAPFDLDSMRGNKTEVRMHKERPMVHRFVSMIRHLGEGVAFETYLGSIQRTNKPGAPTFDEARKDYRSALRSVTAFGA